MCMHAFFKTYSWNYWDYSIAYLVKTLKDHNIKWRKNIERDC